MKPYFKVAIVIGACALFAVAPILWMAALTMGKLR